MKLHNYDLNNVEHLHQIIQGIILAVIDGRSIETLSNWKQVETELKRIVNISEDKIEQALDAIDFETKDCGEAGLEILLKLTDKIR